MKGAFGYELSVDVPSPPEAVWAIVADYERDSEWREGVTMRCDPRGLAGVGTRTFEELRMFGQVHDKTARIDRVEPGRSLRFRGEDGSFEGTRSVERAGDGTRLSVTLRVEVTGALGLLAPLLGWLFRRRVQRDLARLRALASRASVAREGLSAAAE